jgi:DNA-binding CsgD family transcriptional regulator
MERVGEGGVAASGPAGDTIDAPGSGLALLMEEWSHGVVVTTVGGQVVHANGAARRELARGQLLVLRHRQLFAPQPDNAARLQDALARAANGKRSLLTLGVEPTESLTFAVLPLKHEGAQAVASVALVFERASVCESLMLWFFARAHGLTPTEEQVVGMLCQGYSAPEAARQLRVAVSTVRTHIRGACLKTRTNSVRELVGRVAVLPPVAPFWQEPIH